MGWKSAGQRKCSFCGVDSYRSNASRSIFYLSCSQAGMVDVDGHLVWQEDGQDLATRAAPYSPRLGGKRKPRKGSEQARWVYQPGSSPFSLTCHRSDRIWSRCDGQPMEEGRGEGRLTCFLKDDVPAWCWKGLQ